MHHTGIDLASPPVVEAR